jgi:polysaccharide deacetylase 2 family uncharacterized protein YibQ
LRELGPAGGPLDGGPASPRPPRARRALGAAWALVILLLLGVFGWLWLGGEQPPQPGQPKIDLPLPPATMSEAKPGAPALGEATGNAGAPANAAPAAPQAPALPQQPAEAPSSQAPAGEPPAGQTQAPPPAGTPAPASPPSATAPPQPAAAPATPPASTTQTAETPFPRPPEPPPLPKPEFKFKLAPEQLALVPAPAPDLTEAGPSGLLPRVAADGRKAWRVYAQPFNRNDQRPKIALVIGNLGISGAATEAAIQLLPGAVTLAFSPYSHELDQDIPLARAAGHEVLLSLPMEPIAYPAVDPGPKALLTSVTAEQNLERLEWLLSRSSGYVGVTDYIGSRLMASDQNLRPVLVELHRRGLMFLDSHSVPNGVAERLGAELGLPTAQNDHFLDFDASRAAIDRALAAAEEQARRRGASVAMGFPYPVTIERIQAWARELPGKGIVLAPITAVVAEPKGG